MYRLIIKQIERLITLHNNDVNKLTTEYLSTTHQNTCIVSLTNLEYTTTILSKDPGTLEFRSIWKLIGQILFIIPVYLYYLFVISFINNYFLFLCLFSFIFSFQPKFQFHFGNLHCTQEKNRD